MVRNETTGVLSSVDNALRVLELLSSRSSLRVIEVAEHLDVARSTAHRLLASLLARGFVMQDAHKVDRAGPAIERFREIPTTRPQISKEIVHPHLVDLAARVGNTCHIAVLEGNGARFIDLVESTHKIRAGGRVGMLLPAYKTAIGIVLLAELPLSTLRSLYPRGLTGGAREAKQTLQTLDRKIRAVRRAGYATNLGDSDPGIAAVGMCLRDPSGRAFAGIAVAVPTSRFDPQHIGNLVAAMSEASEAIKQEMTTLASDESFKRTGGV